MDEATFRLMCGAAGDEVGQQEWTAPGTYTFKVRNSRSISAVLIGAGGSSPAGTAISGGGEGGDLRYAVSIPVTPDEELTVIVGATGQPGGDTVLMRGATVLLRAAGGRGGEAATAPAPGGTSTPIGANVGGGDGAPGGPRNMFESSAGYGGGAGGYSGNGGTQTGGCGGNGGKEPGLVGGGGGGVGIKGEGASGLNASNGTAGDPPNGGGAGSGGTAGFPGSIATGSNRGRGGLYGGGAGGNNSAAGVTRGGDGACRIIWGPGRAYPSTNTQDIN